MTGGSRVLVIGDVMTDIIVMAEGALVRGSDRRAAITSRPGGSGANQAVWLARMDAPVDFAARVGASDRRMYEAYFRGLGVVPVLAGDEAKPTGVLVTIVDPGGERSFFTDRGANLNLCEDDLTPDLLQSIGFVMVSGYSFFSPGPRAAVVALLAAAAGQGVARAVDAASVGFLEEVGAEAFLSWTKGADMLFANEAEALLLSGESEPQAQMEALGQHYAQVVLKRGAAGAMLGGRDGIALSLAAPAVEAIDTTGAGDAFAAGFIALQLRGGSAAECLLAGIEAGSAAVQQIGGQPVDAG
ncbi:ribokinase [Arsenicitalea aurantiaca]|uniref:Ribokinase n=1 Tax=Arsenicitalea aurantiaca TaxID=1783274 RepID=A0A433X5G6_9HYPH|nr:PfkB family carbohydrate kinase [Arsenicitalea aurantiaca]RUT29294.1 ribokinase [Arsenicitalea aurantiaca]